MTPSERYRRDLERQDFVEDAAQAAAVRNLQRLYDNLLSAGGERREGFGARLGSLFGAGTGPAGVRGVYLWGGVGRGKTYLVDAFYECLPGDRKRRVHFHRFMASVHHGLEQLRDQRDPLSLLGRELAGQFRLICLDELSVSDITDAMILARLFEALFAGGVTLVTTSNTPPDRLYRDGLQRVRFLPAIDLIKQHMDVVNVDGGVDYRLQFLETARIYHHPVAEAGQAALQESFEHLAPEPGERNIEIEIEGRTIAARRVTDGVVWFDFEHICDGPRGTADYIEIARCYHSVLVSGVPRFTWELDNQARRFLTMVDEFYDRNVKLILLAAVPLDQLYSGEKLAFDFRRATSRLHEMQSHDYLARPHLP